MVKYLPAMQETWVRSLGWEHSSGERNDSPLQYSYLENSMEEPGGPQSIRSQRVRTRLSNTDTLAGCVVLSKSLSLSESLVLNLHNEENTTSLIEFF